MTTEDELHGLILRLANHIYLCFEILGKFAERRQPPILTETDYPLE